MAAASIARAAPEGGVVVVGGDRDYPPYEFLDDAGRPAGYNVELTRAIAEVMGMRVEIRLGGWAEMREGLGDGRIDALQGMSYSDARAAEVDFSPPHTIVHHAIFARRDTPAVESLDGLRGHEVLVHRAGIMDDLLTARGYGAHLVRTDTPAGALRLLASGRGDYAVVASVPGEYLIRELGLTTLRPVARRVAAQQYCYAVRKGDAELLARFSEGLAILKKTGRYQAIHERWLGVLEPHGVPWGTVARYGAGVLVPLLLALGGIALWSRSLRSQVAQRTASLAREVAERQRAMEDLRVQQQQLVQAGKMAALGVLVSGVAHEINNPNALILLDIPTLKESYLDLLEIADAHRRDHGDFEVGGVPYSEIRDHLPRMLDEMADAARRIKRIVDDLKDFARVQDATRLAPMDLNAAVQAAVRLVEPSIRKSTRRFSARYGDGLPRVCGISQRVEQVVVNLVLNACQALPSPDRAVELSTERDPSGQRVLLRVRDEGVGIPPEHLARLTDPFFTTRREAGGTGLGLSVSAGIVKEHGGVLEFAPAPGGGTIVTLSLPAAEEGSAHEDHEQERLSGVPGVAGR